MKNYYRCYKCKKDAQFFFQKESDKEKVFYNHVHYWDNIRDTRRLAYKFVCSECVILEMALTRLQGNQVHLMEAVSKFRVYDRSNKSLKEWLQNP